MPRSIPTLCGSITAEPFSLAVRIHTAAYQALDLDYTFVCFGVENPELAVQAIRTLGIRGMSVSMPYKAAVMPFLDEIDPAARAIGAVNTINNQNGRLIGYNSDFIGAVRALQEATDLNGQKLALLGAGGAARAVAYGTKQAGAQVTIFNRSAERGKALAQDLGVDFGGSLRDFVATDFAILVNATSVGFRAPERNPIEQELHADLLVMDIAFIPVRTKLLQDAAKAGCRTIPGTRMLLHQACKQVELYTERPAPLAVMEKALLDAIEAMTHS